MAWRRAATLEKSATLAQSPQQTEVREPPSTLTTAGKAARIGEALVIHLLVPAAFVLFVLYIMPLREGFEFDSDEGINLMKASLYGDGYKLYSQIWSDQPPLFTAVLAGWLKITGASVLAARLLVLLFVTLLIWAFAQVLRSTIGIVPAIAGVFALTHRSSYD